MNEICAMRTRMKLAISTILLLSIFSLPLVSGCGKAVNGKASGGCPDNAAPYGSTISAPTELGAPSSTGYSCYPSLAFTVLGSDSKPMNGICVEIFSDGSGVIALHSGLPDCSVAAANPQTSIIARTDSNGNVLVEFITPPTTAGSTHFVEVTSGAASAIATTAAAI